MNRTGWMSGAKALAASTALACVAMMASTAAQADYSYTFTLSGDPNIGDASGSFTTNNLPTDGGYFSTGSFNLTPVNASFTLGGITYDVNNGTTTNNSGGNFSFISSGLNASLSINGRMFVSNTANGMFGGPANVTETVNGRSISGQGFFATMTSSAPGGGGGGGGGGGSGGAPTPEVNAGLGILIAGASFTFLRRKRGGRHEAVAA